MINTRRAIQVLSMVIAICGSVSAEFELKPFSAGFSWDQGQIVKGRYDKENSRDDFEAVADGQVLSRTGIYLSQTGVFNDRLFLTATIGAIQFRFLPEKEEMFHTRLLYQGGSVGQASAAYRFGDPEEPSAEIKGGFFPIKYNPDIKNLGEYLYRSGAYPTILYSGGWSYVNSAAYMGQGFAFRLNTLGGMWTHDLTFTFERDLEPVNDISPAYVSTIKAGAFEFGFGAQWSHLIPLKPDSVISPMDESFANAYVKEDAPVDAAWQGRPLYYDINDTSMGNWGQWSEEQTKPHYVYYAPGDVRNDTMVVEPGSPRDTLIGVRDPVRRARYVTPEGNGIPRQYLTSYTFSGIKTMARASVNIGTLLGMDETHGPDAFKIYMETALLGVQNQPYLYDDRTERMPVMFGINIPTFGVLDMLSFEIEYMKSRYPNNIQALYKPRLPLHFTNQNIPDYRFYDVDHPVYTDPNHPLRSDAYSFLELENNPLYNENHPDYDPARAASTDLRPIVKEIFERDDWRWSVYARKQITAGLSITAQAARDHSRHFELNEFTDGARPMNFPATRFGDEWYYVFRLEMGI